MYWFPLKILYSTCVVAVHTAYFRGAGLYAFFNILLWVLLGLNLYWFYVSFLLIYVKKRVMFVYFFVFVLVHFIVFIQSRNRSSKRDRGHERTRRGNRQEKEKIKQKSCLDFDQIFIYIFIIYSNIIPIWIVVI